MVRPHRGVCRRVRRRAAVAILALGVTAGGCGGSRPATITVFAASSLQEPVTEIAERFESAHNVTVQLQFDGSANLARQIAEGAPADLFVSADAANLTRAGVSTSVVIATNRMALAVPRNDARVTGLNDLARPELRIGLCAPAVPCGRYAREVLDRAAVVPALDTEEPDVRSLLAKVASGDLDAAIVYVTDLRADARVAGIELDPSVQVEARYPAAALTSRGESFLGALQGEDARATLRKAGFGTP